MPAGVSWIDPNQTTNAPFGQSLYYMTFVTAQLYHGLVMLKLFTVSVNGRVPVFSVFMCNRIFRLRQYKTRRLKSNSIEKWSILYEIRYTIEVVIYHVWQVFLK